MSDAWIQRFAPRPQAPVRLFCLTHAGASAAVYRPWALEMPPEVEVLAVQLPGHGHRMREPVLDRMEDIVRGVAQAMLPLLDRPFALFGHSMGAVVSAELARHLQEAEGRVPAHLFVSGRRPPHWPSPEPPLHTLSDTAFVDEIQRRYGGIPPEVAQQADVMALLLPALRADIRALETHLAPVGRAPLGCPVSVFGGTQDPLTPREHLEGWRDETQGPFALRMLPGDHFYLAQWRAELLRDMHAALTSAMGALAREGAA